MGADTYGALLSLRARVAEEIAVEVAAFPGAGWVHRDGVVQHERTDFFQLVGRRHADGRESILIRQQESALVGLGVAERADGRFFLLNARAEPGLHGLCQFSTTIQSTPSNYERRHGGRATPFIDHFFGVAPGRLLHKSWQYDLGAHYDRKTKQFTVVMFEGKVPAIAPLEWVSERDVRRLLAEDRMVTSDLRVALALLDANTGTAVNPDIARLASHVGAAGEADDGTVDVPLADLTNWTIDERGAREHLRDQGTRAFSVRTTAGSREVSMWEQPLLDVDHDLVGALPRAVIDDEPHFAVALTTQRGLAGIHLWHPATMSGEGVTRARRSLSAEGGRFWNHGISVSIVDIDPGAVDAAAVWLSRAELETLAATELSTTVELRLALSLAQEEARHGS